jgi:hypothetical protein
MSTRRSLRCLFHVVPRSAAVALFASAACLACSSSPGNEQIASTSSKLTGIPASAQTLQALGVTQWLPDASNGSHAYLGVDGSGQQKWTVSLQVQAASGGTTDVVFTKSFPSGGAVHLSVDGQKQAHLVSNTMTTDDAHGVGLLVGDVKAASSAIQPLDVLTCATDYTEVLVMCGASVAECVAGCATVGCEVACVPSDSSFESCGQDVASLSLDGCLPGGGGGGCTPATCSFDDQGPKPDGCGGTINCGCTYYYTLYDSVVIPTGTCAVPCSGNGFLLCGSDGQFTTTDNYGDCNYEPAWSCGW